MYKIVWVSNMGLWYICVDTSTCIKYSTGVVDDPTGDDDWSIASQGAQNFEETVFKLWRGLHSDCEDDSNNNNEAKDGSENFTGIALVGHFNCRCRVCNTLPIIPY